MTISTPGATTECLLFDPSVISSGPLVRRICSLDPVQADFVRKGSSACTRLVCPCRLSVYQLRGLYESILLHYQS